MNLFSDHPIEEVRITGGFSADYGTYKHRGIDYSAVVGTPVYYRGHAPATVQIAEMRGSFGVHVRLRLPYIDEEGPLWAVYAHMSRLDVGPDYRIQPGERIGLSGASGANGMTTYAPHLHWQVYLAVNEWGGSSRDIALSRDPALMIGEDMSESEIDTEAALEAIFAKVNAMNSILVMERDLRHLINAKHPGVPKLHKFLRDGGGPHEDDFEYDGDYREVGL